MWTSPWRIQCEILNPNFSEEALALTGKSIMSLAAIWLNIIFLWIPPKSGILFLFQTQLRMQLPMLRKRPWGSQWNVNFLEAESTHAEKHSDRVQMDAMWATHNTEKLTTWWSPRSILDFLLSPLGQLGNTDMGQSRLKSGKTSDTEQGQMDVKNVSWLIWKEHAIIWENIWAVILFCRRGGNNSKVSHPV